MDQADVLISSAGRRVALVALFREALTRRGWAGRVHAGERSACSSAFHAADGRVLVPSCDTDGFVPALLEACRRLGIRLVVPTIDTELAVLAEHRSAFADIATLVAVSDPETIAIASDKVLTHEWLRQEGFPTVDQAEPAAWPAASGPSAFPAIVKPRRGSASIGVHRVADAEALAEVDGTDLVVQSIAPGVELTVDAFVDSAGRPHGVVPRQRLEVRAGEVQKAVTRRLPAVEQLVADLCRRLPGAFGPLCVQLFLDEATGAVNVIEINPRFGGGYPLSWQAGARYPEWLLDEATGRAVTSRDEWQEGLVMLRYDDAVYVDAAAAGLATG